MGRKPVDRIRGPELAGHRFCGIAPGFRAPVILHGDRKTVGFCGRGCGLALRKQERKRPLHGHCAAVLHGDAIPEMILIGHGLQQVDAGLMLQGDVAFQLRQQVLLQFAHGALAVEQVTDKEQRQCAETEEGDAECPLVPDGMEENQRIHEHGQASRLHQNKGSRQDRELQLAPFEIIQFLAVQRTHDIRHRLPSANGRVSDKLRLGVHFYRPARSRVPQWVRSTV